MAEVPHRLTAALSDRYRLERELGAGGMATVYLAHDVRHDRKVAVKVLKPDLAAALGPERFLREIAMTASLRHPHILPLYDSGRAGGSAEPRVSGAARSPAAHSPDSRVAETLFYVMPYVEGETLRDRLRRERQLPVEDALQIAREVADALSYAHQRGVIHRDIKPENILLEHGHAVVADFGIARAVRAAGGDKLTQTGLAVGTPTYMSPEQAAGEGEVDGRSDLYALGCVLYEMLGGQPPFTGPTVESVVYQHLTVEAPPITNLRPAVPAELAGVLQRALAKNPADRFNPVTQFGEALRQRLHEGLPTPNGHRDGRWSPRRRAAAAALAVVTLAVAIALGTRRFGSDVATAGATSIAVLPFADLSADESGSYLGDGIAETLINSLANVPGVEVAARTSAFSFRGKNEDVRAIGRYLGVATVLEGSVQRAGGRLRITAQLVKTSDGLHLWSQSFDRDVGDIFAVQDEVARAVVGELRVQMGAEGRLAAGTSDPEAYEAYLLGRFFWNKRTMADLEQAIVHFEEALARDSSYAQAWAGLADTYLMLPFYSTVPSAQTVPKAREAAENALALNPDLAEAQTTLAYTLTVYYWDWSGADRAFRRAIALNPSYATAYKWYSDLLHATGRFDEALAAAQRAAELDPRSPNVVTILGMSLWFIGEEEQAMVEFERALALDPTFPLTLMHSSWLYWTRGDTARFFEVRERLDAVSERGEVSASALRAAYAAGGPDSVLQLQINAPSARRNPVDRARWHALLGDFDAAFADLEQAVDERTVWLPFETEFPYLASLRADPRYAALRGRMGLP